MTILGQSRFQQFFRVSAGLHVDKNDLKRYRDFLNRELYDMLVTGQTTARENLRDIPLPSDLPITKGLQQCMHEFQKIDTDIGLLSLLEEMEVVPPTDLALSGDGDKLPQVAGGVSVALAKRSDSSIQASRLPTRGIGGGLRSHGPTHLRREARAANSRPLAANGVTAKSFRGD